MTIRDDVKVYRVPFTLTAVGVATVIADSPREAILKAKAMDLGDFVDYENDTVTISEQYGYFTDTRDLKTVELSDIGGVTVDDDYSVEDHPDYDPVEHDEEGEAEGDPGEQEPSPDEPLRS